MAKHRKTEILVGLFLLLGLILIAGGILTLGNFGSEEKTYPIRIKYRDAAGLIKGSNVMLGGASIGVVSSPPQLTPTGDSVILEVRINKGVHIYRGSEFRIDLQNMLGNKYIDVIPTPDPDDGYIQPNELIMGHSQSDLSKIRENALAVSTDLANLLKKLDQNSDGILEAIDELSTATKELSEATRRINNGILNEKNLKHLENILANIDKSSGEVPMLMTDARGAVAEFKEAMSENRQFIANANQKLDALDEGLAQIAPAMKSFRTSADEVSLLTRDLNKGKGTLGLLLKDAKFRKEFETFIRNLRDYGILRYRNPNEPQPSEDPRAGYSGTRR